MSEMTKQSWETSPSTTELGDQHLLCKQKVEEQVFFAKEAYVLMSAVYFAVVCWGSRR